MSTIKNVQGGIGKDMIISAPPLNTENEEDIRGRSIKEHVHASYEAYKKAMQK
ncbi:hypothetical protein ACFFJJ_01440 [Fictibacillus phosphorivorans]